MYNLIKKYWDIFGGLISAVILSILAELQLDKIQLIYSIIILLLVSVGAWRILKQAIEKNRANARGRKPKERQHNIIDGMVDSQKPVKAINLATNPTKEGEKLGRLILETIKRGKKTMTKIKKFFDKFKGYLFTICLGILSMVEMCGGYINDLLGDKLTVNGVNLVTVITFGAALIVGIISNGYSKEDKDRIKALFTKSSDDELVKAEIKKTIKKDEAELKELNKTLDTKENELDNLHSLLDGAKNTHQAKQKMYAMVPQLATADDVQQAANEVVNYEAKIVTKNDEITKVKFNIETLTTKINALKSQL